MLGVRRSGVTLALGALEKAGIVRQGRGRIAVLDRAMLEGAACTCYGIVADEYRRLLAPESPRAGLPRPTTGA